MKYIFTFNILKDESFIYLKKIERRHPPQLLIFSKYLTKAYCFIRSPDFITINLRITIYLKKFVKITKNVLDTNTGKGKDKTEKLPRQKKSFFVHQFATDTKHRTVMYVITLNTEL
jgi:hypothetical protein